MILKQTQVAQRTLTDSWRDATSTSGIPVGVILDISVNTPEPCKVGISSISADGRSITCTLVKINSNGTTDNIATVTATDITYPVSFDCQQGYSASVLFGYIPDKLSLVPTSPVVVSNTCVASLSNSIAKQNYLLEATSYGEVYTCQLDGVHVVKSDRFIDMNMTSEQQLMLSLSDYGAATVLDRTSPDNQDKYNLKSINNISAEHLIVSISNSSIAAAGNCIVIDGQSTSAVDPIDNILDTESIAASDSGNSPLLNYSVESLPDPVTYDINELYDKEGGNASV